MWCGFVTVHMLLLNVTSFPILQLVPTRIHHVFSRNLRTIARPSFSSFTNISRRPLSVNEIGSTETSLLLSDDRFVVYIRTHLPFWRLHSNLKYRRILDDGRFGKVVDGDFAWWTYASLGVERLSDGLVLIQKRRMWAVLNPSFFMFQPFFVKAFRSGTVPKRSLHDFEVSFDIVWFDRDSYKTLWITSDPFIVWSSMFLPDENTWYILASGKFSLIPSFLIIIETRSRKKACCYPMGDKKTTYTAIVPWF